MKKLVLFILLLISVAANAQKGISYQAVILDPSKIEIPGADISGQPLMNGNVWVKFAILSGSTSQFEEIQQTKTDAYGLVNLTIGSVASSLFNALTWDANQKTLQVFVSFNDGASYTKVSDQKLTYTPYALFAETAGKLASTLQIAGGGTGATTAVGARANLGLGNVDNTSDASKPISAATQTALDLKANTADVNSALALKATVAALEAHMAITADLSMLATKAALTDLNDFAPIASPTFTGSVSGITKSMVGLGSVDNSSDLAKPVSTATQAALDLKSNSATIDSLLAFKSPLLSPSLTGVPTAPTASPRNNSAQLATTAYTDAAIAVATAGATSDVAASKITGIIPVSSGGTGQTTVVGILTTLGLANNNIAIGSQAGTPNQGVNKNTVAIGGGAGRGNQGQSSIAIGYVSGDQNQGANSVSIGGNAAQANQAAESVAIGFAAGQTNQGTGAIAIGTFAGQNSQAANSIALNAAGSTSPLNPTTSGLFVNPIRNATATSNVLYYNTTTKEVTSGSAPSGTSGTAISVGTISSTSNANGASITAGVLNLTPANATNGGIVTTGSQTFAGAKTFSSDLSVSGKLGLGTATPNAGSSLDIATALPIILPKMTQTQINALTNPTASMLQFNTTAKKLQVYKEFIANAPTLFGNTTLSNGATCLRGSGELWFRPTVTGIISQIELNAFGAGEVASLVVNSNYAGASPASTLLGSSNSITMVDGWNTWTFATPVPVVANTTYFITSTDANRCLGVRWANSGDDATTGNVDNMGYGNPLSTYDPASRITVIAPAATNGWVNLKDDVAMTNLSSEVTNVLPVANGGTGLSTLGSAGQVLTSTGSGTLTWTTASNSSSSSGTTITTGPQTFAGAKTFSSDLTVNGLPIGKGPGQTNYQNISLGTDALANNTNGQILVAIGNSALYSNTTANYNIGIGVASLSQNTTGENNIGIGAASLANNNGANNTAIGRSALLLGSSLNHATSLGFQAGMTNTGSNNTFLGSSTDQTTASSSMTNATAIGYNAKVGTSNTIQLGNPQVTNVNTSGAITAGAVTYPNTNGSAGQVLTANSNGQASWTSVSGGTGPQIITEAQRDALNVTSSGVMIFNSNTNQYQGSVYYTTGYNYNYFTTTNYGFTEIRPGYGLTQTFTGKGQVITSADIAVVNMGRVSNTGNFTFAIWDETYQYALFSTTITLSGAGTVSVTIPNNWMNLPQTLPNGPCSIRITSASGTGGSADFLLNAGASVGSLSNSYWSSLGGTAGGYTTPDTGHQLAIDLFPQNGLRWVSFN
jgi:hypothetical protein